MSHAKLSPSGAAGWMRCAGWASDSKGSAYADEGTAAHFLASECLTSGKDTKQFLGLPIVVSEDHGTRWQDWETSTELAPGESKFRVDQDMARFVQTYVDYVRDMASGDAAVLLVEQRLPITGITGEEGAHGTSDVVILDGATLTIVDLKYGRGVEVQAEGNEQLRIYALAALDEFGLSNDFTQVRMVIHQPRMGGVSEWVQTVEQLEEFRNDVQVAIVRNEVDPAMRDPSEKACKWCANKATCTALGEYVQDTLGADFEDLSETLLEEVAVDLGNSDFLSKVMAAASMIEDYLKAVRAEVESRLLKGVPVPGYKLVQGRRGARAWTNADAAEQLLKTKFRLKVEEMYDLKLISPTSAEKLTQAAKDEKPALGPRQWKQLQDLIGQADGKPSVAPESDKRPAINVAPAAGDFDDLAGPPAQDSSDLA